MKDCICIKKNKELVEGLVICIGLKIAMKSQCPTLASGAPPKFWATRQKLGWGT